MPHVKEATLELWRCVVAGGFILWSMDEWQSGLCGWPIQLLLSFRCNIPSATRHSFIWSYLVLVLVIQEQKSQKINIFAFVCFTVVNALEWFKFYSLLYSLFCSPPSSWTLEIADFFVVEINKTIWLVKKMKIVFNLTLQSTLYRIFLISYSVLWQNEMYLLIGWL